MDVVSPDLHETIFMAKGAWFLEILIGLFVFWLLNYAMKRLIRHFRRRALPKMHDWKEKLDEIIYLPLHVVIWVVAVVYVVDVISIRFDFPFLSDYLEPFRNAAIVGCLGWLLLRWKKEFENTLIAKRQYEEKAIDAGTIQILSRLASIGLGLIVALVALQILGLNIMPLVAFGGIGAAALGFAAKDVIANFFGGLMLFMTRPFTKGDSILVPEKNIEGDVEEIGWYLTSIRDKEKRPLYLPNAMFSTMLVINASRLSHRRILETISLRYSDFSKISVIVEAMRKQLLSHPSIDTHLPVLVFFHALKEFSLDLYIDAYSLSTRYDEFLGVKQEILQQLYEVILSHGAQVSYPKTQVELIYSKELSN